jgi:putative transposase
VRAFLADGSELGILKAQGAWGEIRHDLKLRREIMKLRAKKRLAFTVTQEFINRFVEEKPKKAKPSRRAASDLERTMRALANAPTANTPPGPPKSGPVAPAAAPPATTDSALPAQTPQKIEPQKLTIPSGFTTVI